MADLTLLSLPASPFAMSVKMALAEKGVPYKALEERFQDGKSQRLLDMNPVTAQVPVLVHEGKAIFESLVILEYIEEVWKSHGTDLLPGDNYNRALARFWANYCNTKFWEKALLIMKRLGEEQLLARDEVVAMYRLMDKEWSKEEYGKPFLFGEKLSMADLVLAPFASWKLTLETLGMFTFPGAEDCPRMAEWLEAVEKHPSVQASILDPQLALDNGLNFQSRLKTATLKL